MLDFFNFIDVLEEIIKVINVVMPGIFTSLCPMFPKRLWTVLLIGSGTVSSRHNYSVNLLLI